MSKDEFEETVKDLNDHYWRLLISLAISAFEDKKRNKSETDCRSRKMDNGSAKGEQT